MYRTEDGGLYFSPTLVNTGSQEPAAPIVDSQGEETDQRPTPQREPLHVLSFIFILLLFLLLDSADSTLSVLLAPTATITITPQVRTVRLTSSMQLGNLLSPITLSESQTVPTTGHGHQNAERATGSLTFYNGLFTQQFITQGTEFTGSDGVQIVTDESVTIPANAPPVDGQATVMAHALNAGVNGNMNAGDVDTTINNGLLVRNSPFSGGQDERNFSMVTKADRDTATLALKAKVTASMTAALQSQLMPGEQLSQTPCTPSVTANHAVGEEAQTVTVTVAESCTAIAYDTNTLQVRATQQLITQAVKATGKGYMRYGNVQVSVTKASTTNNKIVVLSFISQGIWVYHVNEGSIQALVSGKPRLTALHLLLKIPGIHNASISGIPDNQELPDDLSYIHLLIIVEG